MTGAVSAVAARDVESVMQRHVDAAGRALIALLRAGPLCGAGASGSAAKFHEGAISALAQLRREIYRDDRIGALGDVEALARTIAAEWRERATAPAARSPHWQAYLAGGAHALDALAAEVGPRAAVPSSDGIRSQEGPEIPDPPAGPDTPGGTVGGKEG